MLIASTARDPGGPNSSFAHRMRANSLT
jgi:hypothetical protein